MSGEIPSNEAIVQAVVSYEEAMAAVATEQEHAKDVLESAVGKGIRKDIIKNMAKLRKMTPLEAAEFIDAFDTATTAVGLRSQLDMFRQARAQVAREGVPLN